MVCSSVKWYDSLSQEGTKQSTSLVSPCGCRSCPQQASSCLLFGLDFWLVESRLLSLGLCFFVSELANCLFYSFCGVLSCPRAHTKYCFSQASGRVQKSRPAGLTGSRSSRSASAAFHINNNNKLDKNQLKIFTESLVTSRYLCSLASSVSVDF